MFRFSMRSSSGSSLFTSLSMLLKLKIIKIFKKYVVWQKSNETDFLLTMNFILFTNQGYPLQNSSLGHTQRRRRCFHCS